MSKLPVEQFEKMMDGIIDDFDFEKVAETMNRLGWKWASGINPTTWYYPDVSQLRQAARSIMRIAYNEESTVESGGFQARYIPAEENNDDPDNVPYLRLSFLLEWAESL